MILFINFILVFYIKGVVYLNLVRINIDKEGIWFKDYVLDIRGVICLFLKGKNIFYW